VETATLQPGACPHDDDDFKTTYETMYWLN